MGGSNCGVPFVGDGRPFPSSFPGSFPCLKRSETASWKDRISRAGLSVCFFPLQAAACPPWLVWFSWHGKRRRHIDVARVHGARG